MRGKLCAYTFQHHLNCAPKISLRQHQTDWLVLELLSDAHYIPPHNSPRAGPWVAELWSITICVLDHNGKNTFTHEAYTLAP